METFRSLIPLGLTLLIGYLIYRWFKQRPKEVVPLFAAPIPEYKGFLGFFKRHYNGDYSLARSYWVNTLLVTLFAPSLGFLIPPWLSENFAARYASTWVLLITAMALCLWVWAAAGTWASAGKHVSRGGKAGWATLAKFAIVIGAMRTIVSVGEMLPSLNEHLRVALGEQPGASVRLEVRSDGKSILLTGGINDGSADQLSKALDMAPSVKTVVLESDGGWIREGVKVAQVIRSRGLNTYVETFCSSACTFAFLAGRERAAAPTARIGFHSPHGIGATEPADNALALAQAEQLYRAAGLPDWMLRKIAETPTERMWYPSIDDLLKAGVLTRRTEGGETTALATSVKTREALSDRLQTVEAFRTFAQKFPGDYDAMLSAAWSVLQRGGTDAEMFQVTRSRLAALVPTLLPGASDSALFAFWSLTADQLQYLSRDHPDVCARVAFQDEPPNASAYLSRELNEREVNVMGRLIGDFDRARIPPRNEALLERYMEGIFSDMTREQLAAFLDKEVRSRNPVAACSAAIAFFNGVSRLGQDERQKVLRQLFLQK